MTAIEKFLHEHFASLSDADVEQVPSSTRLPVLPDALPESLDEPFAKANTVAPGSPADTAGLKPGDEIRNFGYVNRANHDGLRKVAECVQGNEGVSSHAKISNRHGIRYLMLSRAISLSRCRGQLVLPSDQSCG